MPTNNRENLDERDALLKELILYISERSQGDDSFGAIKLNKLLFYSDFLSYLNFGEAITGQLYFKLPMGPAPKRLVPVRERMVLKGDIKMMQAEFYGFPQERVVPLRSPDLTKFSPNQIVLIDKLIKFHWGKTASEISDESHEFFGWVYAQDKEEIPYSTALIRIRSLDEDEIKYGMSLKDQADELVSAT